MNKGTRKPDDIMAEYLLSGAKMLADLCSKCGAPMFEVNGKRTCVICADTSTLLRTEIPRVVVADGTASVPEGVRVITPEYAKERNVSTLISGDIISQLDALILRFCTRMETEPDPARCLSYMECIRMAAEARAMLNR
jgi:UPF0148 protein